MRAVSTAVLSVACGFTVGFSATFWQALEVPRNDAAGANARAVASGETEGVASDTRSSEERVAHVAELAEKNRDDAQNFALYAELQKLDAADFKLGAPKMIEVLKRLAEKHSFSELVGEAWMDRWLEVDAPGALQFLASSRIFESLDPKGQWKENRDVLPVPFEGVFKAVARREPEWARTQLLSMKADASRDAGVTLLATIAAEQQGTSAKKFLMGFLDGPNRPAAIEGYATGLSKVSPSDAFQIALEEPAGPFREKVMERVLWGASTAGSGALQAMLDRIDDPLLRARMAGAAIGNAAHRTREDVLPWLKAEIERTGRLDEHHFGQAWNWALQAALPTTDFPDAAEWALTLSTDPDGNSLPRIMRPWLERDSDGLRSWLSQNVTRMGAKAVAQLGGTLREMIQRDAQATANWVAALPPGPLRDAMQTQSILGLAKQEKTSEAQAAYAALAGQDRNGAIAGQLAGAISATQGEEGGKWALTLPPGPARTLAVRHVADQWGQRDPEAVARWINDLPAGTDRDAAIVQYAEKITYADPSAAAEWVLEIQQPMAREEAAQLVFWTWLHEDPGAAATWARQLPGVSDAWRNKLLRTRP